MDPSDPKQDEQRELAFARRIRLPTIDEDGPNDDFVFSDLDAEAETGTSAPTGPVLLDPQNLLRRWPFPSRPSPHERARPVLESEPDDPGSGAEQVFSDEFMQDLLGALNEAIPQEGECVTGDRQYETKIEASQLFSLGTPDAEKVKQRWALLRQHDVAPEEPNLPWEDYDLVVGQGEAPFLRARAALWTWRALRTNSQTVHAEGPPAPGRNVLTEQRIGQSAMTFLVGYRVTVNHEATRQIGFSMRSLYGQLMYSAETFSVEWRSDDDVVFQLRTKYRLLGSRSAIAMAKPMYHLYRRGLAQSYLRNMAALSAE